MCVGMLDLVYQEGGGRGGGDGVDVGVGDACLRGIPEYR